jgi:hypothetical protein
MISILTAMHIIIMTCMCAVFVLHLKQHLGTERIHAFDIFVAWEEAWKHQTELQTNYKLYITWVQLGSSTSLGMDSRLGPENK